MREIKFRTWDEHNKKMIFGPKDDNPQPSWVLVFAASYNTPLMQYTGLKDKNGKEIYEGDIVQVVWPRGAYRYQVCFGSAWNGEEHDDRSAGYGWYLSADIVVDTPPKYCKIIDPDQIKNGVLHSYCDTPFEIVGNIHESPELMEKSEPK